MGRRPLQLQAGQQRRRLYNEGVTLKGKTFDMLEIVSRYEPPEGSVRRLRFADARLGCAISMGHILVTSDGGGTWQDRHPIDLKDRYLVPQAIHPLDSEDWWLLSTYLEKEVRCFQSTNSGQSWAENSRFLAQKYNIIRWDLFVADKKHGWILLVEAGGSGGRSSICRTVDGGRSWSRIDLEMDGIPEKLVFANAHQGWVPEVQWDRKGVTAITVVHSTADGGVNWKHLSELRGDLAELFLASNGDLFLCGREGILMRSTDTGKTWGALESHTRVVLNTIHFRGPVGIAAGTASLIRSKRSVVFLLTKDNGCNWRRIPSPTRGSIQSVYLTARDRGVIETPEGLYQFRLVQK